MGPSILFVEGDVSIRFAAREYFDARGFLVDCAGDADEALDRLASSRYDAVVAELHLPGDSRSRDEPEGLPFIERVRRDHPGVRVLVLTAFPAEVEAEARRRGAHCFLQKPQRLSRVAEILEALCRGEDVGRTGGDGGNGPKGGCTAT